MRLYWTHKIDISIKTKIIDSVFKNWNSSCLKTYCKKFSLLSFDLLKKTTATKLFQQDLHFRMTLDVVSGKINIKLNIVISF